MIGDKREVHLGFRTTQKIKDAIEVIRTKRDFKKYTLSDIIHLALEEYMDKHLQGQKPKE
jgi:hypothetical protein